MRPIQTMGTTISSVNRGDFFQDERGISAHTKHQLGQWKSPTCVRIAEALSSRRWIFFYPRLSACGHRRYRYEYVLSHCVYAVNLIVIKYILNLSLWRVHLVYLLPVSVSGMFTATGQQLQPTLAPWRTAVTNSYSPQRWVD